MTAPKRTAIVTGASGGIGEATAIQANVADPGDVPMMFQQILDAYGRIDVVVHSAGMMPLSAIAKGDLDLFDKVIAPTCAGRSSSSRRRRSMGRTGTGSSRSPAACSVSRFRLTVLHRIAARALARAGNTVYATMRETTGRDAAQVEDVQALAAEHGADLRALELDVASQDSVDDAFKKILADTGRLDVLVHNVGHMVFGLAEAFTPEQLASCKTSTS